MYFGRGIKTSFRRYDFCHLILSIFSIAEDTYKEKDDDFWDDLIKDADLNDDGIVNFF